MNKILLIALNALFFCSCTTFIPTGSEYDLWFAVKKVDGKEQWGVVQDGHAKGISLNGKKVGFIHLSSVEKELGWPYAGYGIGVKYDSIKFVDFHSQKMFFAYKDCKNYYYSEGFRYYADEQPVERLEYVSVGRNKCFNNKVDIKFYLEDGSVYTTNTGIVEDVEVGFWGYALKENGKWGYFYGRSDIKTNDNRFTQTVPFAYDEIIESLDMKYMKHLVFARQGNVWHTYNKKGERIPTDMNMINHALKLQEDSKFIRPGFSSYAR